MKYPEPPPQQPSWLSLAQATFNLQANRWDPEHCGGGLRWQIFPLNKGFDYKNSISNGGFFQLAARLARYTGNDTYAQWADKTWDWMHTTPLFTENYDIYDGVKIQNCSFPFPIQWSYNVGTFLMGAANMYNYVSRVAVLPASRKLMHGRQTARRSGKNVRKSWLTPPTCFSTKASWWKWRVSLRSRATTTSRHSRLFYRAGWPPRRK